MIKLQTSQTFEDLRADLHAIAGINLRLIGPKYKISEVSEPCSQNALCGRIQSFSQGQKHCRRFIEGLVLECQTSALVCNRCDAGLVGISVPLRLGGETLGYLLTGGYRTDPVDPQSRNRVRHLLGRMHVDQVGEALIEYESATEVANEPKHEAIKRWLKLAAGALIKSLELRDDASEHPLPAFVIKICSVIQERYKYPPSLGEAAQICNLSEGYFSRAFHEHTGLRFVEYIHAVRVEHVCDMLLDSRMSITEAAFEVGFNTLSQFNRVFRKVKGASPREWRKEINLHPEL